MVIAPPDRLSPSGRGVIKAMPRRAARSPLTKKAFFSRFDFTPAF
jgi:hypothetical protein